LEREIQMQHVNDQMKDAFSPENARILAEYEAKAVELRQQLQAVEREIKRIKDQQNRAFRSMFQ